MRRSMTMCYTYDVLTNILEELTRDSSFTLMFDESLNKENQMKQLDMHIRIWDGDVVRSRYLSSAFLGHSTTTDLIDVFSKHIQGRLGLSNIIQLSMDGPNVNWAAFRKLEQQLTVEHGIKSVNIGSCGLHTVHNSFRKAVTSSDWNISGILKALSTLFENVPARREDYAEATGEALYPLKWCSHRWVENVPVIDRALAIRGNVTQYIRAAEAKKFTQPKTKSFTVTENWVNDSFGSAKLLFIKSIARAVEWFLRKYQDEKPLILELYDDLSSMMVNLMSRFIKSKLLEKADFKKCSKIDIESESNQKSFSDIQFGYEVEEELKRLQNEDLCSAAEVLQFKAHCKRMFIALVKGLFEKSPASYGIVKELRCFNPHHIKQHSVDKSCRRFKKVLAYLQDIGRVKASDCDDLHEQFRKMLDEFRCQTFDEDERADKLYHDFMNKKDQFSALWCVIKKILLLSHGQAQVERGFSINKEVSSTNMSQRTLMARRIIKDHMTSIDGIDNFVITKELIQSCKLSRQQYMRSLESEKNKNEEKVKCEKRKIIMKSIEDLKEKRRKTEANISLLKSDAELTYDEAERTGQITLVTKANALRRRSTELQGEMRKMTADLEEKEKLLKNT